MLIGVIDRKDVLSLRERQDIDPDFDMPAGAEGVTTTMPSPGSVKAV
jgi:hypothetical protein